MNGIFSPSYFPKNTSSGTCRRIIDAAVKGGNTKEAALKYKSFWTDLKESFYKCLGWSHYEQDKDKGALEGEMGNACKMMTETAMGLTSNEFMLKDNNGIPRYFRVVASNDSILWGPFTFNFKQSTPAVRIYQYDQSSASAREVMLDYCRSPNVNVRCIYNRDYADETWSAPPPTLTFD
ncbi:MAG: hypothetical protein K0R08_1897 [Solimicrobium sp.]|jgi:hypothetical protein|nr:hypothetical protein [Solimicrobium sp.]